MGNQNKYILLTLCLFVKRFELILNKLFLITFNKYQSKNLSKILKRQSIK
ncbi:hypothetical protein pb186bvf_020604 [Paramecium bursaria]